MSSLKQYIRKFVKRSISINDDEIIYAVPGHPLVAERTVQLLLEMGEEQGVTIEVSGGQSFLDDIFRVLRIDPIEGFQLLDGTDLKQEEIELRQHLILVAKFMTHLSLRM